MKNTKKSNQPKLDKLTQSIDYVFKMLHDGRMDKEEAGLAMEIIFSKEMEDEDLEMIKFMHKFRPKNDYLGENPVPDMSKELTITIEIT